MFLRSGSGLQRQHVQEFSPSALELLLQILMACPRFASGTSLRHLPREQTGSFYQRLPHPSHLAPLDPAAPPQMGEPLVNVTFDLLITAF